MKKFFRNLFSGYILILLALLIEGLVIIFFQFGIDFLIQFIVKGLETVNLDIIQVIMRLLLSFSYLIFKIFTFIIEILIFFKIVNKAENPEFKIPWIVGLFILPLFTSVLYLIFGIHHFSKNERHVMELSKEVYKKHSKISQEMHVDLGHSAGTFNYLNNVTSLGAHKNNKVTYFGEGADFFDDLIAKLKEAKEFIFIEFFIISDGKYWQEIKQILIDKAKEGVEVKLIYDDMGTSGSISPKTPKELRKYGIGCYKFHPFKPILSGVFNNRDHRKIVVIDHKYGYTGGINLADEYGNLIERFGYWKDSMIRIEGSAIDNLITIFLQNYDFAQGKASDFEKYLNFEYPKFENEGYVMPFGDGPGLVDNALVGEQTYINIINYAKSEVYISTPYLVPTYGLIDAMRNAALRGVKVHLIVPGIPDKKLVYKVAESNFAYLLEAGVNIYRYTPGFNHQKSIIADERLAMVGTINFDFRSLVHHYECGAVIYKDDTLTEILEDHQKMVQDSTIVPKDYKQKGLAKRICDIIKVFSALL